MFCVVVREIFVGWHCWKIDSKKLVLDGMKSFCCSKVFETYVERGNVALLYMMLNCVLDLRVRELIYIEILFFNVAYKLPPEILNRGFSLVFYKYYFRKKKLFSNSLLMSLVD